MGIPPATANVTSSSNGACRPSTLSKVVPPGIGIVHQVNFGISGQGVLCSQPPLYYPDTLVGTDSHTHHDQRPGHRRLGVGGTKPKRALLGQPVYFLTPDVVGVYMTGSLKAGVTPTDLALTVTQMLRPRRRWWAKFVGVLRAGRGGPWRWWTAPPIANMARNWRDHGLLSY